MLKNNIHSYFYRRSAQLRAKANQNISHSESFSYPSELTCLPTSETRCEYVSGHQCWFRGFDRAVLSITLPSCPCLGRAVKYRHKMLDAFGECQDWKSGKLEKNKVHPVSPARLIEVTFKHLEMHSVLWLLKWKF